MKKKEKKEGKIDEMNTYIYIYILKKSLSLFNNCHIIIPSTFFLPFFLFFPFKKKINLFQFFIYI